MCADSQAEEDIPEGSAAAAAQQHHHQQGSLSQPQQGQPRLVQPCPSRREQSALLLPAETWPEAAVYDHCHVALHLHQHVRFGNVDKLTENCSELTLQGSNACCVDPAALFHPKTFIWNQKRHPYTGNLASETSGDSKFVFLHCGDVFGSRLRRTCKLLLHTRFDARVLGGGGGEGERARRGGKP